MIAFIAAIATLIVIALLGPIVIPLYENYCNWIWERLE